MFTAYKKEQQETMAENMLGSLRMLMNITREPVGSPEEYWNRSMEHRIICLLILLATFKKLHKIDPDVYSKTSSFIQLKHIYKACDTHYSIVDRYISEGIKLDYIQTNEKGLCASKKTLDYGMQINAIRNKIYEETYS